MRDDLQKHHRRSIRLPEYDYSQTGAYFVTLCAWRRECLFGVIREDQMQLSLLGEIIQQEWYRSAQIRQEIELTPDEFIIMPNHIHGIVRIIDPVGADGIRPDGIRPDNLRPKDIRPANAGAGQGGERQGDAKQGGASLAPLHPVQRGDRHGPGGATHPEGIRRTPLRREGRSLGSFVAGFKAAVTTRARDELDIRAVWQRNYYEHIIRDQEDYESILAYIQTNPLRWVDDQLHLAAVPHFFKQE